MRPHTQFRRGAIAALTTGSLALLTACGSGGTQPADAASDTNKAIAFSPLALQIPAMKGLSEGVQGYAKGKGYSVLVQDPNMNPQKQVTDLKAVIESGRVGGAWVIAVQPSSLSDLVKTAQEKKVPLLLNGTPEDYGLSGLQAGLTFDRIDYQAQGKAMGTALGECVNDKLDGKGEVVMLTWPAGTAGKEETEKAALDALTATAPNAKVVTTIIASDRAAAQTDVASALQGQPGANAVLSSNDEGVLGALGAFDAAGRDLSCAVETGGNDEVLGLVKDGRIHASVALQFQQDMAQSFDTLVEMMADPTKTGQQLTVPQKVIKAGS